MFELILVVITGTMVGLIGGLFFAFSVAINGALHRLKDGEYIRAMQWIDHVIQRNGLFLLCFMAPIALLPLTVFLYGGGVGSLQFALLGGSAVAYLAGPIGVTFGGNIPLNTRLGRFDVDGSSASEVAKARDWYEMPWNRLHAIRTVLGAISILLFLWSLAVR
jgi:uncharacterized membrane protein